MRDALACGEWKAGVGMSGMWCGPAAEVVHDAVVRVVTSFDVCE
ncbi:hypothetical protein DVU_2377 [Nitratidesulfovibrio vulgaris str. Hildenborough]|uniref:Uncharacterized protein n=1 Tax=Nitratidesulfovibrio vulgaris (strain ATCC 29579 / DSM 644 / CCUG 34227 / NCIMB 8303 / VKM B-1760 / Hildenborough) TaxID=882 RepID=Q729H4_NITV2|nr:hypothetical protein DVU_2377 [Nitratidesulfovibrio vulgaris str. Hildenborough]